MPIDFLSALIERWNSDGTLAASGMTPLHYGSAPDSQYPYATLIQVAGKVDKRAFGGGHMDHEVFRISITTPNGDDAAALGEIAEAALDAINDHPLTFDDGTQVAFLPAGDTLLPTKRQGTGQNPYVFIKSLTYSAKVWKGGSGS